MAETIVELLTDVADAIREKKGTSEPINAQSFADEIRTIESGGNGWTGHADAEGLRAIGWDDEDIAYYQKYGVDWNEEDDEYHKVSDDNKALYGVLTVDNIQTYKDRIVYLPKIDTSGVTSMSSKFKECRAMVAIPMLDTSNVTRMDSMFAYCSSLTLIPSLDTSKVTEMSLSFLGCFTLVYIPFTDTNLVTSLRQGMSDCYNLFVAPLIDTSNVTNFSYLFTSCRKLTCVPFLNVSKATLLSGFDNLLSLVTLKLYGLKVNCNISGSALLSKESLLYIINNEAATSAITITLHAYAYQRLAEDADIVEALNNHPLISLASA